MESTFLHQTLRAVWIILLVAAAIVAVYWAVPLLYPFMIGWVVAFLLQPTIRFTERRFRSPRWLSVTIALLLIIGVLGGLATLLVAKIGKEIQRFAEFINNNYQEWFDNINVLIHSDFLQRWAQQITRLFEDSGYGDTVNESFGSTGQNLASFIASILEGLGQTMINFLTALPNVAVGLIVAILAAFFIGKDWETIRAWTSSRMPEHLKLVARSVWRDLQKALFGFVRAQLILIAITAVFVIVGLLLLRVPYAITIGLLIGLVDLLPYLGTGVVFVPWIIYVLLEGQYSFGFGLTVLYALIIISRQLAEPKIYSSSIGLNPLVTLIGMFVGLKLFGFIGLVIGPVVMVLLFSVQRAGLFRDIRRFIVTGKYFSDER